ncbi:glycoside hydrolase family 95 protein [Prevotella sp.]|uniref:glycoside hydrolase family 95 protein n=1 Tax=Prevotella sp. TaxID=59823 RepID=UPI003DA293D3
MKKYIFTFLVIALSLTVSASQLPMRLWYNSPAQYFEESLPIGNGKLGALVYGNPDQDILYLNDITFWTGKPVNPNEGDDAYKYIPLIRQELFKENYKEADILQHMVQGHNSENYQPLSTLKINDYAKGSVSNYYRELDIDSAITKIKYTRGDVNFYREYFASNPDKLIAIHLSASKKASINCEILLTGQTPHKVKASDKQITMLGNAIGDPKESIHFCSILKADNKGGKIEVTDSSLQIINADEATLYFVNETSFNGFDKHPVNEGADYIENATNDIWHTVNYTYQQFRERHISDYRKIYSRLSLNLNGAKYDNKKTTEQQLKDYTANGGNNTYLETLYFQYGRYLLISSSRTPSVPANLQGLWTPHKISPWRGNYTVNINLEENYWHAEEANLSEMVMPLDGFISSLAKTGKYTAEHYYGINQGWCSSHNSDIWAMSNPVGEKQESPEWSNWNMGGAWLVNTLWEHYDFNRDKKYLHDTAYPLMKGASDFMLKWLIENPNKKGELITAPSTSPENEYVNDKGYHGTTCYGGTADLAIIRELLTNTRKAAQALNIDKSYQDTLASTIKRLHPYTVGHMGDINEWYYDWDDYDFQHRHQSHLIGLYPGHQITVAATPELAKAATRTLEIKGDKTTGWSTGWRINLWARLHRADMAYHIFQKLLTYVSPDNYKGADRKHSGGTYPNLFDAHPPFQIDGNFGGTAGVCEMLMQSDGNTIQLLPACPASWKTGSIKGLKARGGFIVNMDWKNGKIINAEIFSTVGGTVKVIYNNKVKTITLSKGKIKKI